jgi:hypothetical protein
MMAIHMRNPPQKKEAKMTIQMMLTRTIDKESPKTSKIINKKIFKVETWWTEKRKGRNMKILLGNSIKFLKLKSQQQ